MKQLLILLVLSSGLAAAARGQDEARQAIQQRLNEYFEATKSKDWDKTVNLLYPKLFSLVSKEDMVQMFRDMEGNGVEFEMKGFELLRISDTVNYAGESFALIGYSARMNIRFTSQSYQEASVLEAIRQNYEATYGAENVHFRAENNSFGIRSEKAMFAIAPEGSSEWTFMESEPGQESLLRSMIPDAARQKLAGQE